MQNGGFDKIDGYKVTRCLGWGGYGYVYEGIKDEQIVAIKIQNKSDQQKSFKYEYDICNQLDHKYIIKMIEYKTDVKIYKSGKLQFLSDVLVMNLYKKGNFREHIKSIQNNLNECKRYLKQILEVLEYLQKKSICHLDIKPENILLDEQQNFILTDFGVAKSCQKDFIVQGSCGTKFYRAPEIDFDKQYNGIQADIYSAGILFFEMYAGFHPFSTSKTKEQILELLKLKKYEEFWLDQQENQRLFAPPEDFKKLIVGMISHNPKDRFTVQQCLIELGEVNQSEQRITNQQFQNFFENQYEELHTNANKKEIKICKEQQKTTLITQLQESSMLSSFKEKQIISSNINEDYQFYERFYSLNYYDWKLYPELEGGMQNQPLVNLEAKFIMYELLSTATYFNGRISKIYRHKYKMNFDILEKDTQILLIQIYLQSSQEQKIRVNIVKLEGDSIKFYKVKHRIITLLSNI